jgi:hypothetical protein
MTRFSSNISAFIFIFFCFISCSDSKSDQEIYFDKLDKAFSNQEKRIIQECESSNCLMSFIFTNTNDDFKKLMSNIPQSILDSISSEGVQYYKNATVFFAYCKNQKGMSYSYKELEDSILSYYEAQDKIAVSLIAKDNKEWLLRAKSQYDRISVEDSVQFVFPYSYNDNSICEIKYRPTLNGENSITINCLVTNKKFIQKSEEHNPVHDEYILSLQVLDISKKECGFTLKEPIDIGDELEIELFSYARVATGR